jgi:hypothetical protein
VHRPGLEHTRLTPSNAEELLQTRPQVQVAGLDVVRPGRCARGRAGVLNTEPGGLRADAVSRSGAVLGEHLGPDPAVHAALAADGAVTPSGCRVPKPIADIDRSQRPSDLPGHQPAWPDPLACS